MSESLPNVLGRTREEQGDRLVYRYANGLTVQTDKMVRGDAHRVLPIGGPQETLLNHLLHHPDRVRGKRVFEPFAGSGPLGLMALKLGAAHVDFLDVNPRAVTFERENAAHNGFAPEHYRAIEGSIEDFVPDRLYDLILANPPFVPTPEGIRGTLTSNGGADGNSLVEILLKRLNDLLEPAGEAFVFVFQLVSGNRPLVADLLESYQTDRHAELTPAQQTPIQLQDYVLAYRDSFPDSHAAIGRWETDLSEKYGSNVTLQHYVIHILPASERAGTWAPVRNLEEKYGEGFACPTERTNELALARVWENL